MAIFKNCHLHFLYLGLSILNNISLADNLRNTPFSGDPLRFCEGGEANSAGEAGKIMVNVGQNRYIARRRWRSSL